MNNPFDYIPSEQMLQEQLRLRAYIENMCAREESFRNDVVKGKMFGILITDKEVLWAFSGQIGGSFNWHRFVPAVYDYLDETGYFKTHEREITALNHRITALEESSALASVRQTKKELQEQAEADIADYKQQIKDAKLLRDKKREEGMADEAELLRESQFMKAELHRRKLAWRLRLEEAQKAVDDILSDIRLMKLQRQQKSDRLQRWLFEQFVFTKSDGTNITLPEIFDRYFSLPLVGDGCGIPSGSGECCEPKLLNYAYSHGLKPVEMGMFWWGESPRQEVRRHLQFYPACNGKCKPILMELLPDTIQPIMEEEKASSLEVLFEDESIIVVNKPSGMLSVPGKEGRESVFSILSASHPECKELSTVHRLDMDTSGLLVVAKTKAAHENLQKQFLSRQVKKTYVAILEKPIVSEGRIELPLRPDFDDRPRQMVDYEYGKPAVTEYFPLGGNRVELYPLTGRTHQLRVHCAHHEGLNNPIKGDRLYGQKDTRLYLHAKTIELQHPATGKTMRFSVEPEF